MEDEIDFRDYLNILLRQWKLIIACVLVGVLVAGGIGLIVPIEYKASVTLTTSAATPNVATLAMSEAVLKATIDKLGASLPAKLTQPNRLSRALAATQASTATAAQLTVTYSDATLAAAIANAWAETVKEAAIDAAQHTYGESAAVALQAQLNAQQTLYANALVNQADLDGFIEDARLLRERLSKHNPSDPAAREDEVLLLGISLQAIGAENTTQLSVVVNNPQLAVGDLSGRTVQNQLQGLDGLIETLTAERQAVQARTETLKADIQEIQMRQASSQISLKAPLEVQIFQAADVPSTPASRGLATILILGFVVGLMTGVVIVLGWDWWKKGSAISKV